MTFSLMEHDTCTARPLLAVRAHSMGGGAGVPAPSESVWASKTAMTVNANTNVCVTYFIFDEGLLK